MKWAPKTLSNFLKQIICLMTFPMLSPQASLPILGEWPSCFAWDISGFITENPASWENTQSQTNQDILQIGLLNVSSNYLNVFSNYLCLNDLIMSDLFIFLPIYYTDPLFITNVNFGIKCLRRNIPKTLLRGLGIWRWNRQGEVVLNSVMQEMGPGPEWIVMVHLCCLK